MLIVDYGLYDYSNITDDIIINRIPLIIYKPGVEIWPSPKGDHWSVQGSPLGEGVIFPPVISSGYFNKLNFCGIVVLATVHNW